MKVNFSHKVKFWYSTELTLLLLFVTALVLRIPWFGHRISRDSILYLDFAHIWGQTSELPLYLFEKNIIWMPVFPIYLYQLFERIGLPLEASAIAINIILGSLLPLIFYFCIKLVTEDRFLALGSALFLAVSPSAIDVAVQAQRDTMYLFFSGLVMLFLILVMQKDRVIYWLLVALFSVLSFLCRYEALELYICTLGIIVWKYTISEKKLKQMFFIIAIFGIVTLVCYYLLNCMMGTEEYCFSILKSYLTNKFQYYVAGN